METGSFNIVFRVRFAQFIWRDAVHRRNGACVLQYRYSDYHFARHRGQWPVAGGDAAERAAQKHDEPAAGGAGGRRHDRLVQRRAADVD